MTKKSILPGQTIVHIRKWLLFFMIALIWSGLTAIDVVSGIIWLKKITANSFAEGFINQVHDGLLITGLKYPFIFYGYDWLVFAHLVLAILFIGPYRDPLKNEWVIQFGMIACAAIIPFALTMGLIRHIPFWWICIDMSFGILGIAPLYIVYKKIQQLKKQSYATAIA